MHPVIGTILILLVMVALYVLWARYENKRYNAEIKLNDKRYRLRQQARRTVAKDREDRNPHFVVQLLDTLLALTPDVRA